MSKKKDILADFSKSLADKPVQETPNMTPAPPVVPPEPLEAIAPVSEPRNEPSRRGKGMGEKKAAEAPPSKERLGYQKITISLTQADLDWINQLRLTIAQRLNGKLLNTSQLLKVAIRELHEKSPTLAATIATIEAMDLRRSKEM